jgi:hypothetical protein
VAIIACTSPGDGAAFTTCLAVGGVALIAGFLVTLSSFTAWDRAAEITE